MKVSWATLSTSCAWLNTLGERQLCVNEHTSGWRTLNPEFTILPDPHMSCVFWGKSHLELNFLISKIIIQLAFAAETYGKD